MLVSKGQHLTPLDYCSEEHADLAELLRSFGGLTGEAAAEQRAAAAKDEITVEPEHLVTEGDQDRAADGMFYYVMRKDDVWV